MAQIDANHQGPLVNVASWITLVGAVLLTLTKVVTKWRMSRRFLADDALMIVALVCALQKPSVSLLTSPQIFGIGQTIATGLQVSFGLGQVQDALSNDEVEQFLQVRKSPYNRHYPSYNRLSQTSPQRSFTYSPFSQRSFLSSNFL
jgi:hypothetical protein